MCFLFFFLRRARTAFLSLPHPHAPPSLSPQDRYSRQIGAFGMDAMLKLVQTRVRRPSIFSGSAVPSALPSPPVSLSHPLFVPSLPPPLLSLRQVLFIGVRGVGVETAKNTVLAGARQVTLYDPEPVSVRCSSVFFFSISAGFAPPSLSLSLSRSPLCEDTRPRATPLSVSCVAAARASHNNLFRRCFIASPPSLPWRSLSALQLPHFPTPETNAQLPDLGANFFLQESDVGKPRAVAVAPRLAELNPLVKVEAASDILDEDLVARHDAVVVTSGLKQVRPALTVLHVAAAGGRDELRCESTRQCLPPAWPLRCRVT